MWKAITKPFAWLMVALYNLTGNYGWSVILFALVVNLILTPFMAKSKRSMMHTTRIQPKIQELQRRHEGNQQKLNQEMQKLYQEEGINPMSGCIWSLIPFPILIALYSVIRQPLTRMMFVAEEFVDVLRDYLVNAGLYTIPARANAYEQITLTRIVHENWNSVIAGLGEKLDPNLLDIDFSFIGLNLGDTPDWRFFSSTNWSDASVWGPALGLFLIPFISALLSWASMKISQSINPQPAQNDQTAASMKSMNLVMPLMSVYICFIMPAAMGIYWIANSVFGMARDFILTKIYKKKLDIEDAERIAARNAREMEIEAQRVETERLRAEGKTQVNTNTSKKKLQASEKQKNEERKAALDKAERAARRERLGIKENEKPASQVGNRRYARGRAYVPDRFSNPEDAEAATLAAAMESENAEAIDTTVEDDFPAAAAAEEAAGVMNEDVEAAVETAEDTAEATVEEASDNADEAFSEDIRPAEDENGENI